MLVSRMDPRDPRDDTQRHRGHGAGRLLKDDKVWDDDERRKRKRCMTALRKTSRVRSRR